MKSVYYSCGGIELIDQLKDLWQCLNTQHAELSPHFSNSLKNISFAKRKAGLHEKSLSALLLFDIALCSETNITVGYCISSVSKDKTGEIESIFIVNGYRGYGIGRTLMENSLEWMVANGAEKKIIGVMSGNEKVLGFYAKFGFYPRTIVLEYKPVNQTGF